MHRKYLAALAAAMGMGLTSASAQDVPLFLVSSNNCIAQATAAATNSLLPPDQDQQNNTGEVYAIATAAASNAGSFAEATAIAELGTDTYVHESQTSFNALGEADSGSPNFPATAAEHRGGNQAIVTHQTKFGPDPPTEDGVLANVTVVISTSTAASASGTGTSAARVVGAFTGQGLFAMNLDNPFGGTPRIWGWYNEEGVGVTNVDTNAVGIEFVATLEVGWGQVVAFGNRVGLGATGSGTAGGEPGGAAEHEASAVASFAIQGLDLN
jgi:hypothetical protein